MWPGWPDTPRFVMELATWARIPTSWVRTSLIDVRLSVVQRNNLQQAVHAYMGPEKFPNIRCLCYRYYTANAVQLGCCRIGLSEALPRVHLIALRKPYQEGHPIGRYSHLIWAALKPGLGGILVHRVAEMLTIPDRVGDLRPPPIQALGAFWLCSPPCLLGFSLKCIGHYWKKRSKK